MKRDLSTCTKKWKNIDFQKNMVYNVGKFAGLQSVSGKTTTGKAILQLTKVLPARCFSGTQSNRK
jgi:ABC-type oligopeptide transport system ATPase subunit